MPELILHDITNQLLQNFLLEPTHSLLLSGPTGSGKSVTARWLAAELLDVELQRLQTYPYIKVLNPEERKSITIEAVRELEHFLNLRVPGSKLIKRLILIEDAHHLTIEAQNALLKTIEEPPTDTVIFLTTAHAHALLPTIRSRLPLISLLRPPKQLLLTSLEQTDYSAEDLQQAYALSGGLPGLLLSLVASTEHPLRRAAEAARDLLRTTTYERLLHVESLTKDKPLCQDILFILQQMAHVSLINATGKSSRHWQRILQYSYDAAENLERNTQIKLVLTKLMLDLA